MAWLHGWHEIRDYTGKSVRTLQRWRRKYGLPVAKGPGRHGGQMLSSTDLLDRWILELANYQAAQRGEVKRNGGTLGDAGPGEDATGSGAE